jgi:phosphoglycerate dehydrogenase-like enzyme
VAGLLLAAGLVAVGSLPVIAQDAPARPARANRAPPPPDTSPLPEPNMPALIKSLGLVESKLPAREFIKGWRRPKKITVSLDNNVHRLDWLKEVVPPDVQLVVVGRDGAELANALKDADGVIGQCSRALIDAAGPNLHWVHSTGVGMENCFTGDVPARLKDGTIAVTNSARLEGSSVASHGIAIMAALSRGLDEYARMDATGKFTTEPYPRLESLQGKTVLIAGLGGVGSGMAALAHGLGMRVIATNGSIPANPPPYIEHIGLPNELGDMVGQADVVMTALPLTNQTTHLFDAAMFAKFKKGAIFVNVTREEEEVDADLIAALNSGQISSAGFDVIADDSPLWSVKKNIIITPHVAAQNVDSSLVRDGATIWAVARENLRRYIAGDKLISVVDPAKGY